jgi:hypothetical protein
MDRCIDCIKLQGIPVPGRLDAYCPIKGWRVHYSVEEVGHYAPCDEFVKRKEWNPERHENPVFCGYD